MNFALLLSIIVLVLFTLVLLPVWVATLVWVYRDAEKCGKPGILVALLIGLLCWPVGLLVWLILRADYLKSAGVPAAGNAIPPRGCPRCGQPLAKDSAHGLCPACLLQQAVVSDSGAPSPSAFTPPGVAELAPLFPQLEILELLGRGGMGAVYKARQPGLNRFVALKVLPVTTGADPAFVERFQREARALASLNHPHIVNVYDFGQTPTLSWFLMEYVDGVNLRQLERTSRLSPREALAIVPQVCEALQFAHDRGIVHRDIKPENILVDKQGRVKIADFGLAKLLRPDAGGIALTETRHALGTPQYMAPEQVEKPQTVDHRADIYSLGVVFYEMLTGELPIGRFPSPSQRVQVDVRLDEVVLKALEKEPDRRYQQASAFKTNVETVASGAMPLPVATPATPPVAVPPAIPVQAPSPVVPPAKQKKSRWWIWVVALLVLPILVGMALPVLWFSIRPAPAAERAATVPLVLNLEIRNPSTNILERVNLAAGQRAFTDIIRLPHASYTVAGAVWQGRGGRYTLDVTVRNHPDTTSSVGINTGSVGIRRPVTAGVPCRVGKLQEDEFRVTLSRDGDPAASPVTKVMGLKTVLWILLAVVIAGVVWAVKRTGHRAACLGTSFLATSGLLFAVFLARVIWIFHRNAQRLEALDAESLASDIGTAQGIALLAFVLFVVGAIFAGLALFKYRYRARWFYRVVVTAGILILFAFPVGTVLGVMLLVYVSKRRAEFGSEQPGAAPPPAAPPLAQQQSRWWIWLLLLLALSIVLGAFLFLLFNAR